MVADSLYQWGVPSCPVNVYLDIPLADRLRASVAASDVEIGGFLTGRLDNNKTIVTDFELVESEHRRGTAYALSPRDDQHLLAKLATSRKKRREVVGFFRSHMRPGMFLDAADSHTIGDHFNNPQQVALLVRPNDDGSATGGFFFWQGGEMDRKETSLAFPMNSEELAFIRPAQSKLGFDAADTLDHLPKAQPTLVTRVVTPAIASDRRPSWLWIGLVTAGAALGGYLVGTAGTHERFGSRPGDITISDAAVAPTVPSPAPAKPAVPAAAQAAPPEPSLTPAPPVKAPPEAKKTPPAIASRRAAADEMARNAPPTVAPAPQEPVPAPLPEPPPPANTESAFPHNPNPLPAPSEVHTADATADLESVQDGGIKRALHHIPLFGSRRDGQNFQPAQVLKRTNPRMPAELARGLTVEVPVDLKLKVDNTGRVSSVELLSRGSDSALVQLAGNAAYQWQFQPAQLKDRPVASEVIVHFRFKPSL